MSEELISVVIPTFSRPDLLRRSLTSVLNQTYQNLEIIVVDDNVAQPENRQAVRNLVESLGDSRVRLIENRRPLGGAMTRNAGIEAAHSEYIAFLDDDDEYLPERIAKQLERFRTSELPNLALVYCHTLMMKNKDEVMEEYRYTFRGNCVYEGMLGSIAATSQWMCRKDALLKVGCFSNVPCKQDSNLMVKLLVAGYQVDYVPEILSYYFRDTVSSISTQGSLRRVEGEEALRRLCRQYYHLITRRQQDEVEYAFACRLIWHYRALNRMLAYREAARTILRHPLRRKSIGTMRRMLTYRWTGHANQRRP